MKLKYQLNKEWQGYNFKIQMAVINLIEDRIYFLDDLPAPAQWWQIVELDELLYQSFVNDELYNWLLPK